MGIYDLAFNAPVPLDHLPPDAVTETGGFSLPGPDKNPLSWRFVYQPSVMSFGTMRGNALRVGHRVIAYDVVNGWGLRQVQYPVPPHTTATFAIAERQNNTNSGQSQVVGTASTEGGNFSGGNYGTAYINPNGINHGSFPTTSSTSETYRFRYVGTLNGRNNPSVTGAYNVLSTNNGYVSFRINNADAWRSAFGNMYDSKRSENTGNWVLERDDTITTLGAWKFGNGITTQTAGLFSTTAGGLFANQVRVNRTAALTGAFPTIPSGSNPTANNPLILPGPYRLETGVDNTDGVIGGHPFRPIYISALTATTIFFTVGTPAQMLAESQPVSPTTTNGTPHNRIFLFGLE